MSRFVSGLVCGAAAFVAGIHAGHGQAWLAMLWGFTAGIWLCKWIVDTAKARGVRL